MTEDFRRLLVTTLPQMRGYALIKTRNQSEADDLLQQTALNALKAEHQFTMGTNFKAWLHRIMINEFISSIRRKKANLNIDDIPEEFLGQNGDQDEKLLERQVLKAIDKIPAPQRTVINMICVGEMSYFEAAKALRCSVGTVKSRLWRARRAIHAFVAEKEIPSSYIPISAPVPSIYVVR